MQHFQQLIKYYIIFKITALLNQQPKVTINIDNLPRIIDQQQKRNKNIKYEIQQQILWEILLHDNILS